jgi:hypothetical protein
MNTKFLLIFLAIAIIMSIAARLLPHAPNFTPIAALALFSGFYAAKISKWYLLAPLAAMLFSDVFVGFYEPKTMAVVYASFFAISLLGLFARMCQVRLSTPRVYMVGFGAFLGSVLFFGITNFAVWAFSGMYAPTFSGLMLSYSMALPFFKFTLLGNLFYVALFFGVYEFTISLTHKYYGQPATAAAETHSN